MLAPAFLLMLTGFILKGDKEGLLAGKVMYHLAREIPFIGTHIAGLLLRPGEAFFLLPYIHHTILLPLTVLFLLVEHRRRLLPDSPLGWSFTAGISILALVYPLPLDIPPHMETGTPTGPWFFKGIQLVLRHLPPFWAGVFWPLLPLALLCSLPFVPLFVLPWVRRATILTWAAHGALIFLAWWLLPGAGP
jgi:ubiquinol-cytochrome c reductase cytochrome b subunit